VRVAAVLLIVIAAAVYLLLDMDVEKAEWIFFWRGRSDAGLQAWSTMNV